MIKNNVEQFFNRYNRLLATTTITSLELRNYDSIVFHGVYAHNSPDIWTMNHITRSQISNQLDFETKLIVVGSTILDIRKIVGAMVDLHTVPGLLISYQGHTNGQPVNENNINMWMVSVPESIEMYGRLCDNKIVVANMIGDIFDKILETSLRLKIKVKFPLELSYALQWMRVQYGYSPKSI